MLAVLLMESARAGGVRLENPEGAALAFRDLPYAVEVETDTATSAEAP